MENPRVMYEDNHIIAVWKPAGMPTQPDKSRDESLYDWTKRYIKEKYKKPGNVFLGLTHRLDRPVSGIVLFGKTSKGAARLSEQFRNRTINKKYACLIFGKMPKPSGKLTDFLAKEKSRNIVRLSANAEGRKAELDYRTIKSFGRYSLLEIDLKTGKPHQIRVQLAARNCPVVGDLKYGSRFSLSDKSIALAETAISFRLATKNEVQTVSSPIPKSWNSVINTR